MTDERDNPGTDDDGLDAWLAANFPPRREEPPAPPPPTTPLPPEPTVPEPTVPEPTVPYVPGHAIPDGPVFPPMAEELGGMPPAPEFPPPPTEAFAADAGTSGIDSLFGENRFIDYEEEPGNSENPFLRARTTVAADVDVASSADGIPKSQKVLIWIAGSLVAVLALLALFLVGTKLPDLLGPAPAVVETPSTTPTPTATATPVGPVAVGVHRWNELLGGECLSPYVGPWENEYTVVDCEAPHPAQLVTRGTFDTEDGVVLAYPGMDALQSQVNLLCTSPKVVDYKAAGKYTDIQFDASYAVSAEEWNTGNRDYYCFISRSTGGDIEGSLAVPPPASTPAPSPSP
ncbi:hypothetical protein BKA04_001258 [Cryobacterium mesophilum]|uniref:Septum formation n=1 Tax=Terrimesophilobacter mesophilus TaxID=433647 RepID=A0A4R8VCF4_9MICO|nr:hypothetical protein [Terrimesophilobacter mesophilus]MBB5633035.1 hypothetical protein [Terrimesophilobacter mesophilus]TFB79800.1 hypothetical protein E3N84_06930 [Terrimesophilobacter mesophilus]